MTDKTQLYPKRVEQYPVPQDADSGRTDLSWFGPRDEEPLYLYSQSNAFVSPFGVVGTLMGVQRESVYPMVRSSISSLTFLKKYILGRTKKTDAACVVFHHVWYDNYYHWMTECLPRLFLIKDKIPDAKIVLPQTLKRFHEETLALFDLKNVIYCAEHELIDSPQVYFSSFLSPRFGIHHQEISVKTMRYLQEKARVKHAEGSRRIFTLRKNAPKRKCVNEAEVVGIFESYGFQCIDPSDLPFTQQVEIFSQATVIAGIHGSSFVNAAFMNKGGVVLDIMENAHADYCYANFLSLFGIRYRILWSDGVGVADNYRNNDIRVDVSSLKKILEQLSHA